MNTFNSFCIAACIFMIFLGMSFGFISAIGAFPTTMTSPTGTGNTIDIVENLSSNITGGVGTMSWGSVWGIATGTLSVGVIALAILTNTTNMIGVYLFGTFFWSSWASIVGILYTFNILLSGAGMILVAMITLGMAFIFIGAVIGMLSGAHWMR